jgi:hypothetical protein
MRSRLSMRDREIGRLGYPIVLALALLGCLFPQAVYARASVPFPEPESYSVCPSQPGRYACLVHALPLSVTRSGSAPEAGPNLEGSGEKGGLAPKDLISAYKVPEKGGSGQTVAIVDAYNDPNAEADLKVYRKTYGLSECTEANGCFKKVNQKGETANYPVSEYKWSLEISLDLDMVSAICKECHIVLVEAQDNTFKNLNEAENEAAGLKGTTAISNSWGAAERAEETSEDKYFNHPGIPITVSAGDFGYGVEYPASSHNVIAVGGTRLTKLTGSSRGWTEKTWPGTGSGCSAYEEKPAWQTDTACSHRTNTDVAAVASGESPVSVYDSYVYPGWENVWGTSAASPIISGVEAREIASTRSLGADVFYIAGKGGKLFDVTKGSNGTCTPPAEHEYWCTAREGYDGPTGWGTPNGVPTVNEWALVETPNPGTSKETNLWGKVSCTSAEACTTTGSYENSEGTSLTLAERWNGKSWSIQETPNHQAKTGTFFGNRLNGVSCNTVETCTAVGYYTPIEGNREASLAERWNGKSWSIQETPNPKEVGKNGATLTGVACTSSSSCLAVGFYWNSAEVRYPFSELWNGKEWSIQEMAKPGKSGSWVAGVSCSSSEACTAVGGYTNEAGQAVTLAERWSGKEWSIQTTANQAEAEGNWLEEVSCPTATFCTAVDEYSKSKKILPLAESWNGKTWSLQSVQVPASATNSWLHGVSCISAEACTVVGGYFAEGSKGVVSLIETWNGSVWSTQTAPSPPWGASAASSQGPYGVSCTAIEACMAVGNYTGEAGHELPFSEMN